MYNLMHWLIFPNSENKGLDGHNLNVVEKSFSAEFSNLDCEIRKKTNIQNLQEDIGE